jgi:DNA-binding response OmpR family regulator
MQEKILLIDDDKLVHRLVTKALDESCSTLSAFNGSEGLMMAQAEQPDMILLDVEMPGMNGYEVCESLKRNPLTRDFPVVFLSSMSDARHRLLGYEAGADDFLVKPFEPAELLAKLKVMSKLRQHQRLLSEQAHQAKHTAMLAMTGSSELGWVVQFVTTTHRARNVVEIAQQFFRVTDSMKLNCALRFQDTDSVPLYFCPVDSVSPMEREVMDTLFHKGVRIFDFGCRTQVSYPRACALVKNMPIHDMERYGRIKDLLPLMLEAVDARMQALHAERMLLLQSADLTRSLQDAEGLLDDLANSLGANQGRVVTSMRKLLADLDARLPSMGLEEDQEKYLIGRVDGAVNEALELFDAGNHLKLSFQSIVKLLETLTERQQTMLDSVLASFEDTTDQNRDVAMHGVSDVELF